MGVISLNNSAPILVYRKIKGTVVPPNNKVLQVISEVKGTDNTTTLRTTGINCMQNAANVVKQMFSNYIIQEDDPEINDIITRLLNRACSSLHDCEIDTSRGSWYFIEKGKEREALIKYFKDTDPEYLGGFRREHTVGAFESGYQRDMADRLYQTEEYTLLGEAIQNQEGILDKMVDILLNCAKTHDNCTVEGILGEQFNYYDGEGTYSTTIGGIDYWYFDQT